MAYERAPSTRSGELPNKRASAEPGAAPSPAIKATAPPTGSTVTKPGCGLSCDIPKAAASTATSPADARPTAQRLGIALPPHWCSASAAPAKSSQARAGEAKKASVSCVWPSHSAQTKDSADSASAPPTAQRRAPTPPAPVLRHRTSNSTGHSR